MNTEQLKRNVGSHVRLRPVVQEVDGRTGQHSPTDDLWTIRSVERGSVDLENTRTRHTVQLGNDNIREFRSPEFLLLRCQLTVIGNRVNIEPLVSPTATPGEVGPLSQEEHDLLIRARDSGQVLVLQTQQNGEVVAIGAVNYVDSRDPSVAIRYRDALDSLCERGLVRHEEGTLYRLTSGGFKIARGLKARLKVEFVEPVNAPGHRGPPYTPAWNVHVRVTATNPPVSMVEVRVEEDGVGEWLLEELTHNGTRIALPLQVVGAAQFWVRVRSPRCFDTGPVRLGKLTLRVRDHLHVPEDAHELAYGPVTNAVIDAADPPARS